MTIRMALVLCAMAASAGCAAPHYEKPIGTFATATSDAQTALATFGSSVVDAQEDVARNSAVAAPYRVRSMAGECGPSSTRCRLVLYQPHGDPSPLYQPQDEPQPAPPSPARPIARVVAFMTSIADYAGSLNAIATSDAIGKVDANVAAARGAIAKVAALVPGADVKPAGVYAQPVLSSLGWTKLHALQYAVAQADGVIARAGDEYGSVMQQATQAMQAHLADVVAARRSAFRAKSTRENLDKAAAAAQAYDTFLLNAATPDTVFKELVKAHANLNEALQSSNASPETLMAQMSAFQAHVNELARTLGEFQKARAS